MFRIISLISGLLFGLGMAISGMTDPDKVTAFLDVAGNWSADLMFVMGGAIMVFMPTYFFVIKPRQKPLLNDKFTFPLNRKINSPLVAGASIFGVGWGLVGLCPGPVVSSLASGNASIVIFFATMMVGLGTANILININKNKNSSPHTVHSN